MIQRRSRSRSPKRAAAGIPVIAWDADAPESQRIAYVGTDNVAAGKIAGEELAKAIGGKGKVAILTGSLTAVNANQRIEGFKEALKAYPDIEIVATEPTEDLDRDQPLESRGYPPGPSRSRGLLRRDRIRVCRALAAR